MVAFNEGFNFRATAAFRADDPADTQYVLATDSYPTTRNGVTFGWESGSPAGRDRSSSGYIDARLAGLHFVANTGSQATFRVDLVQTGQHEIRAAFGEPVSFLITNHYAQFLDGNTVFATLDKAGTSEPNPRFWDATGTLRLTVND